MKCVVARQVDLKNKILHNQKKNYDLFYQIDIACYYSLESIKYMIYQALFHKLLNDLSYVWSQILKGLDSIINLKLSNSC